MTRYRLSRPSLEPPLEDRILQSLYQQQLPGAAMPAPIEEQVFGDPEAERNTILLRRLMRAEAVPTQHSKFGIVE